MVSSWEDVAMNFATKEPMNKDWSSDKKYCVTEANLSLKSVWEPADWQFV